MQLEDRWTADVTFVVNSLKCVANRHSLAAVSPVFKKMLLGESAEAMQIYSCSASSFLSLRPSVIVCFNFTDFQANYNACSLLFQGHASHLLRPNCFKLS
ncbi:BTB/POZ domain-containing protein [Ditylenchus destructor]|nr:BTB/POZ domain-containing protein [Ditylenchus destructor]